MNYEEKYKQSLLRAKEKRDEYKRLDGEESFVPSDIEYIFPELCESEDERIRKEIISFMTDSLNWFPKKETKESWIAWLEKQGEKKPAWSEKEEKIRKAILELVKQSSAILSPMNQKFMISWLESIKDRVQPKQEWSEGDEKRINSIISSIEYCSEQYPDRKEYAKDINWLKSIKPQPKQEWSEEDEKMLDSIIDCIDGLCFIDSDQLNWLKSIKPNHWKPSEEQMEALKNRTHGLHTSSETRKALESLINDLKKL